MTYTTAFHDKQPGSTCDNSVYVPVPEYEICDKRTKEPPLKYVNNYACFPKNYGASTISIMPLHDHKHEYGRWYPNQFSQPTSRRFPEKLPPLPPLPLSANPPNRLPVATKTPTINPAYACTNVPKYNEVNTPSAQLQKITDTGMQIINNGLLLDESKSTSTTAAITKKTIQYTKDSSKSNRIKGYAIKIRSNLNPSKNKAFPKELFKIETWKASSFYKNNLKEMFRADGNFSTIIRTHLDKECKDWVNGIITNEVKECMKKHANVMAEAEGCSSTSLSNDEKEEIINEILKLILNNLQLSLIPGNKSSIPEDIKFILHFMNKVAMERCPEESSTATRSHIFTIFLFRYLIRNLSDPDELSKNPSFKFYLQIQQKLIAKTSVESECPDFLVPIFL